MSTDPQSAPVPSDPQRKTILVVNDDRDALFLFGRSFRRHLPGARVLTADNGKEGLAVWEKERIDAILTDNRMPLVTGIMLTRKIRETDTSIPIIMMTCSAQDRENALQAGVTIFYAENDMDGAVRCLKQCLNDVNKK